MAKHTKKSLLARSNIAHARADKMAEGASCKDALTAHRLYIEAENLSVWAEHGFLHNSDDSWTPDDNPEFSKPDIEPYRYDRQTQELHEYNEDQDAYIFVYSNWAGKNNKKSAIENYRNSLPY